MGPTSIKGRGSENRDDPEIDMAFEDAVLAAEGEGGTISFGALSCI